MDDADYEMVSQFKWYAHKPNNSTFYAVRNHFVDGKNKRIYMHRFILGVNDPAVLVDHRSRDGLDNRRPNLRTTDKKGNGKNIRAQMEKMYSHYKGVCYRKDTGRFTAHIHIDGVQKSLGCFDTPEDAAQAYDKAATTYFGEFARLNFAPAGV